MSYSERKVKRLLARLADSRKKIAKRKAALFANQGPFDDVYDAAMNDLDGEGLSAKSVNGFEKWWY